MRIILLIGISLLLFGCNVSPTIVPDTSGDSVVMLQLKDQIAQAGGVKVSYGWVLWYAPIAVITALWAYREFVRRPLLCEDGQHKDEPVVKPDQPV
jgi:hypothetical protein